MTLLIVGADSLNITQTTALLQNEGYKVFTASSGEQALQLTQQQPIDLILLDPLLAQDDLKRQLQENTTAGVIHLPAHEEAGTFRGLQLGLDPRVVQALHAKELLAQIRAALQNRPPARRPAQPARRTVTPPPSPRPVKQPVMTNSPTPPPVFQLAYSFAAGNAVALPQPSSILSGLIYLNPITTALVYLFLLFVAEYCTFSPYIGPQYGLVLHSIILVLLLAHAVLRWQQPVHHLLLGLIVVPTTRILSLSLPLTGSSRVYPYLAVAIPLLIMAVMSARVLEFKWADIGLNLRHLPIQVMIAPTGLLLGYFFYILLKPLPLITRLSWPDIVIPALIVLISTGFTEELIYRGILQRAATEVMGRFSIIYIAGLYASLHIGWRSPLNPLCAFALSLYLGWIMHKTQNLFGIALCHGLLNIMLLLVMPFIF